jgi:hypothetical protein
MQLDTHTGVYSGSTPGVAPAGALSTRCLQNVHLVITPWRSGSRAFFSDGVACMKYHS